MIAAQKYLIFAALAALPVHAGLILNNGAPNNDSGNEMTAWVQAEDFHLNSSTNVQGIRFWAFSDDGTYAGSITWEIRTNSSGSPGSILYSGTVVVTPLSQGSLADGGNTQLQFDINTGGAALASGNYWLALHNGPLSSTSRQDFYWQTTSDNSTASGREDQAPFNGVFASNGQEHAFELFNTPFATTSPEPASLTLFGGGLLALVLARRRRRA